MNASDIIRARQGAAVFSGLRLTQIQRGIIDCSANLCCCICDTSGGCANSYSSVVVGGSSLGFTYEFLNNVQNGKYACGCLQVKEYTNTNQSPKVCPDYTLITPLHK